MPIPTLSGDEKKPAPKKSQKPVVNSKVEVVVEDPAVDSAEWSGEVLDKWIASHGGKKVDTSKPGVVTKEVATAYKHFTPKAKEYKMMADAHLKKLQALDPAKTELNEKELDEATGGYGKDAVKYMSLYDKYRGATTIDSKLVDKKKTSVPRIDGPVSSKPVVKYAPVVNPGRLGKYPIR